MFIKFLVSLVYFLFYFIFVLCPQVYLRILTKIAFLTQVLELAICSMCFMRTVSKSSSQWRVRSKDTSSPVRSCLGCRSVVWKKTYPISTPKYYISMLYKMSYLKFAIQYLKGTICDCSTTLPVEALSPHFWFSLHGNYWT